MIDFSYILNNGDDENDIIVNSSNNDNNIIVDTVDSTITNDNNDDDNNNVDEALDRDDDPRLNILILYPDDWRHDSIGSEKPYILTPFLNQLAKEGIRFTHNAVTTSVCWMSRATLWMGQYSSRHKSYKLKCPRLVLPENWNHSWVKLLQQAGYYIGHVGKWQYWDPNTQRLFDWFKPFEGHHWERGSSGTKIHASDLARDYAIKFLHERPKDQPFALSVAFYPPKPVGAGTKPGEQWSPTNETKKLYENMTIPRPEHIKSFQKLPEFLQNPRGVARDRFTQRYSTNEHFQASMRNYYALITGVDQVCKQIVDELKKEGLYNNTMIIFTTDNGMFHGAHGLAGKWFPYQESIRVPLIIYDPRMPSDKIGTLDDSFTLNVDLAETILGAAGVKPDDLMQGRDISDLYLPSNVKNEYHNSASVNKEPWRDEFFYEFPSPERENAIASSTALVRKEWKYIHWPYFKREQLFNLNDDPLEMNDLYDNIDAEGILVNMRQRHDELRKDLHDASFKDDSECNSFLQNYEAILKAL